MPGVRFRLRAGVAIAGLRAILVVQEPMTPALGFRTGLTEGPGTAAPGKIELDLGASMMRAGDVTTYRAGELTANVGVSRRFEARLHFNSYAWTDAPGGDVNGREDMGIGMRAAAFPNRGPVPAATLILRLDGPTGSSVRREPGWRPTARWALGWALPGGVTLHSNLGYGRPAAAACATRAGSAACGSRALWLAGSGATPSSSLRAARRRVAPARASSTGVSPTL